MVLEAIASGLPVIVSDQPPFTEFLASEQVYFVNPADPADLAAAMLAVVQPVVAQTLIQQSQTVLPLYDWLASARLHVEQYQKLQFAAKVGTPS